MGQSFGYDPERKLAAAATGGLRLRIEGIPVPVTMGFSSGFSGSMSALYENTLWDLTSFPAFSLGGLNSTKGQQLARIFLVKGQLNKLYISKDYVVFPEPSRSVEKDGPFANVTFEWESAKPRVSKGSRLVVTRNGKEIKNCDVDPMKKTNLGLGKVASTNDVVEWIVKDAKGTPTHRSSLAFPVIAAAPGLVEYVVTIPVMDEAKK